ncbi:MAG: hypothetical protein ACKVOR_12530 [Flavobacteriales bacterium]
MKTTFFFSFLICATVISNAQDLKPLDYAAQYARLHVRTRICTEVKYNGDKAADSTTVGITSLDEKGRMIHYTEFFAGGKKMADYDYKYDEQGKMTKATVSLVFNNWLPLEFELKHDAKGRLLSRELKENVANFWKKETYTYSGSVLLKSEQWYMVNGGLVAQTHKDYPPSMEIRENSLTYILNEKGLLHLHQLFNSKGQVDRALVYDYEFYY